MGETATHPEPEGLMSAIPDPEPEGLGCEPNSIKCTAILDTQIKTKRYLKWWKYKISNFAQRILNQINFKRMQLIYK